MSNRSMSISASFGKDWGSQQRKRASVGGYNAMAIASTCFIGSGAAFLIFTLCGQSLRVVSSRIAEAVISVVL